MRSDRSDCDALKVETVLAIYAAPHVAERSAGIVEMSVTDVAFACGFGASSLFNTAFKREAGVSPTQFRRQRLRN
jgi:AraC-like DNA-binding protein